MKAPRVFVPTVSARFDLDPARRFGSIEALLPSEQMFSSTSSGFSKAIYAAMKSKRFDPTFDFLAIVGPIVSCCFMLAIATIEYGAIRVLVYDPEGKEYVMQTFDPQAMRKE